MEAVCDLSGLLQSEERQREDLEREAGLVRTSLQQQQVRLEREVELYRQITSRQEKHRDEIKSLYETLELLEMSTEELQRVHANVERNMKLEQKVDSYVEKKNALVTSIDTVHAGLMQLSITAQETSSGIQQFRNMHELIASHKTVNDTVLKVRERYDELTNKVQDIDTKLVETISIASSTDNQLHDLQKDELSYKLSLDKLIDLIEKENVLFKDLEMKYKTEDEVIKTKYTELMKKYTELQESKTHLQDDVLVKQAAFQSATQVLSETKQAMECEHRTEEALNEKIASLQLGIRETEDDIKAIGWEVSSLKQDIFMLNRMEQKHKATAEMSVKTDDSKTKLDELKASISALNIYIVNLTHEMDTTSEGSKCAQLAITMSSAATKKGDLLKELSILRLKTEEIANHKQNLQTGIQQKQEEISKNAVALTTLKDEIEEKRKALSASAPIISDVDTGKLMDALLNMKVCISNKEKDIDKLKTALVDLQPKVEEVQKQEEQRREVLEQLKCTRLNEFEASVRAKHDQEIEQLYGACKTANDNFKTDMRKIQQEGQLRIENLQAELAELTSFTTVPTREEGKEVEQSSKSKAQTSSLEHLNPPRASSSSTTGYISKNILAAATTEATAADDDSELFGLVSQPSLLSPQARHVTYGSAGLKSKKTGAPSSSAAAAKDLFGSKKYGMKY